MATKAEWNVIVSSIVSGNRCSHCRLCLGSILEFYVGFEDIVSLGMELGTCLPLKEIISKLFGPQICDTIPGIDAVCIDCVEKALISYKFTLTCENTAEVLDKVFDNLTEVLNVNYDEIITDQSLYLSVNEDEVKAIVASKPDFTLPPKYEMGGFECEECSVAFDSVDELKNHNINYHGIFTCDNCHKAFPKKSQLIDHFKRCNMLCQECGKSFKGTDKLNQHLQKHIKSDCPNCGKSYSTKDSYLKHVELCVAGKLDPHPSRNDLVKAYACDLCDKRYSTPGGLRVHHRFEHENATPHVCQLCGKKFTAPSYLKIHMVKHTGEKNFKCEICGNRFVSKEALIYHTRRHTGEKPYQCKICPERFVNASARAEHVKFKHIGPQLQCEICSRAFVTPNFLRQHVKRHHDPTSKLYSGRHLVPADLPVEPNIRSNIYVKYDSSF